LEEEDEDAIMVAVKRILIDANSKRGEEDEKVSLYDELFESLKNTHPTNGSYIGLEKWRGP
jgi:hypothetical protein